ncbi:MAG TPA: VOC family protein [Alphaproteobacteria bacterium]|jgi:catechol 2,3-dioxygenase-like lactoylglutathione lyase family enzyme
MAGVNGFSHLIVDVTDLERSEAFYRDVLGLEVLGRDFLNDERPNSTLAFNTRHRIVLIQVPDKVEPFRPNSSSVHHALSMTNEQFDRMEKHLEGLGYKIGDNRAQFRAVGDKNIDIFDPDGHRYQLQTYNPQARVFVSENVGEIACGNVKDYAVGDVKPFGKGKFFVVRREDGFIALSRWCTHRKGLLVWKPEHWCFYCPMHGASYNRKGENTSYFMDVPPMSTHPLSIKADGTIIVRPDELIERDTVVGELVTPSC